MGKDTDIAIKFDKKASKQMEEDLAAIKEDMVNKKSVKNKPSTGVTSLTLILWVPLLTAPFFIPFYVWFLLFMDPLKAGSLGGLCSTAITFFLLKYFIIPRNKSKESVE